MTHVNASGVLGMLQYLYPLILLVVFLVAFTLRSIATSAPSNDNHSEQPVYGPGGKPLPTKKTKKAGSFDTFAETSPARKSVFQWLSVAALVTWVGNAANVIVHAVYSRKHHWWCGQSVVVYIVGSFFVYSLLLISLVDTKPSPTGAQLSTWILALGLEFAVLTSYLATNAEHDFDRWRITEAVLIILRLVILFSLISFYLLLVTFQTKRPRNNETSAEAAPLLTDTTAPNGHPRRTANGTPTTPQATHGYGTSPTSAHPTDGKHSHGHGHGHGHGDSDEPGWVRPSTVSARSWWDYIRGYSVFFPYLWPSKDRKLQFLVLACFLIIILQRGINVLVPYQVGEIIDILSGESGPVRLPWGAILLYVFYRLLQGGNGLLGALRSTLWIPVSQYSFRELSIASFEHVHGLSLDFHLGKKTGEVLSALGKGNSINTFLEQVTFQVIPMLIDLCVAIGYFLIEFDAYYALVVTIVTFWYIYLTIRMAQWRAEIRREMVNADRETDAVKNDSMVSYETVKYFNAENYEFDRYRGAVQKFQEAEYKVLYSLNVMNVTQNLCFMFGLLITCFIAAYQVTTDQLKVGKFVSMLTYMAQLQAPLNYFGTFYRVIQSAMINSERMLELFKEKPTVVDKPGATDLPSCEGDIRFNDVKFAYDSRKHALQGLDFHCAPGTTTAFVGESGGGKSTVFRLLFRFYDIESGSILVDGHDVQDITIDSLRRHIGVVPQDTVLFNESLMYNLKYANPAASDEQIYDACKAASIHDRILSFPDGYDTKVGERGLRLSGGEKQRVAIARTIIKGPRVILLDEATAALDTETEQHIQEALDTLGQGRTMLVIAHRLSTITRADQILVLHEGQVVECGTHDELLARRGRYATMWRKQIKAQEAAQKAKALNAKADRLRRESKDLRGASTSSGSTESSPLTSDGEDNSRKKDTVVTKDFGGAKS